MEEQTDFNKELDELKNKCEEYLNGWKRAKADFINYQKDEVKRLEQVLKFGNQELIKELISVLDSFSLALSEAEEGLVADTLSKESPNSSKGLFSIQSQLESLLAKHGLEKIIVSIGQPFDPALHEAIIEVESNQSPNTVVEEVEKGYTLHGKLIKPARVKVAK